MHIPCFKVGPFTFLIVALAWSMGFSPWIGSSILAHDVVVVVLDDSGSMKTPMSTDRGMMPRIAAAKEAIAAVIDRLKPDTQLGILLMNGAKATEHWIVPLGPIDPSSAKSKIGAIRADGGTPLGNAMRIGMDELLRLRSKQPYGQFRLLVVTDGEATDPDLLQRIFPDLISRGVLVDVIGVDMKSDHSLSTRAHSYRRASDGASFQQALQEVFAESGASDDGGNDFELIAGIPEEMAKELLGALGATNHGTLTESTVAAPSGEGSFDFGTPTSSGPGSNTPQNSILGTFCCLACVGSFVFLVIFAVSFITKKRR